MFTSCACGESLVRTALSPTADWGSASMDRNWLRWLGMGSICGRLLLLLTMASLLVGISYRYMQFNILKGVLYEQIDSTLRTRMILLTNLTSLNFTESQTKRLMQPLLAPPLQAYPWSPCLPASPSSLAPPLCRCEHSRRQEASVKRLSLLS